jgi:hypothetical protein
VSGRAIAITASTSFAFHAKTNRSASAHVSESTGHFDTSGVVVAVGAEVVPVVAVASGAAVGGTFFGPSESQPPNNNAAATNPITKTFIIPL